MDSAQKQGVDLDKLSEQELKYMLELNKPKGPMIGGHEVIGPGLIQVMKENNSLKRFI